MCNNHICSNNNNDKFKYLITLYQKQIDQVNKSEISEAESECTIA